MTLTKQEQIVLLNRIFDKACTIFGVVAQDLDEDDEMFQDIVDVETDMGLLLTALVGDDEDIPVPELEDEPDITENYYEYILGPAWDDSEGEIITKTFPLLSCHSMMTEVAKTICFADCSDTRVTKIVFQGREVEYVGWQPAMVYEFMDKETKEVVWSGQLCEWEH